MKIVTSLLFLGCLLTAYHADAQDICGTKLVWHASQTLEVGTSQSLNENTTVVSFGRDSIQWLDQSNVRRYGLKVLQFNGGWPNITTPGRMIYDVSHGTTRGLVIFDRKDALTIRLMLKTDQGLIAKELKITSVTLQ